MHLTQEFLIHLKSLFKREHSKAEKCCTYVVPIFLSDVENVAAEKLIFKKLFYDYQPKALTLKL